MVEKFSTIAHPWQKLPYQIIWTQHVSTLLKSLLVLTVMVYSIHSTQITHEISTYPLYFNSCFRYGSRDHFKRKYFPKR